jgi:hypothetical protein
MEKYKLNNMDAWRFTEDEKNELRQALIKYDSNRIDDFIDELELLCHRMKLILERMSNVDRQAYKLDLERSVNRLKKALIALKWLKSHSFMLDFGPSYVDDLMIDPIKDIFSEYCMVDDTIENLEKIVSLVKSTKPPDSKIDPNKFATAIYSLFLQYFEKPTTYEGSPKVKGSGPSVNVLKICLNAVGIQIEDASRHATAALKNLS